MSAAARIAAAIRPPTAVGLVRDIYDAIADVALETLMGDAEHVHLHRQADGTYTAVPMREVCRRCGCEQEWHDELDRRCGVCNDFCVYRPAYVDAPTGGDA